MKRLLALPILLTLLLAACKSAGSSDTIEIGFIGPLTGDAAALGTDILHGTTLAVEEYNAKVKDGKNVKLVVEDGRCSGADATAAAQKLVNIDGVLAIVGGACSSETLAAAAIAEAAKVVVMSPSASSPDITNAGEYVFRVYPSDMYKTTAMTQLLREKGYKKIALVTENNDYAVAIRTGLQEKNPADAFVLNEMVDLGTKDFRSLLTRLKDAQFDVFIPNASQNAVMGEMIKQFRELGFTQPIVSQDVADTADVLQMVGNQEENVWTVNVPDAGKGQAFEETFENKFGKPQAGIVWAAYGYDAARVLLAQLTIATNGEELRKALQELSNFKGIIGDIHFDENGDVVGIPLALKQYQKGTIVTLREIPIN